MGHCPCIGVGFASGWRTGGGPVRGRRHRANVTAEPTREPEIAGSSRPQKITEASDSSGKLNNEGTGALLLLSCSRKFYERVVVFDVLVYV